MIPNCEMITDVSMDGDEMNECGKPGKWLADSVVQCDECKLESDKDPGLYRRVIPIDDLFEVVPERRLR